MATSTSASLERATSFVSLPVETRTNIYEHVNAGFPQCTIALHYSEILISKASISPDLANLRLASRSLAAEVKDTQVWNSALSPTAPRTMHTNTTHPDRFIGESVPRDLYNIFTNPYNGLHVWQTTETVILPSRLAYTVGPAIVHLPNLKTIRLHSSDPIGIDSDEFERISSGIATPSRSILRGYGLAKSATGAIMLQFARTNGSVIGSNAGRLKSEDGIRNGYRWEVELDYRLKGVAKGVMTRRMKEKYLKDTSWQHSFPALKVVVDMRDKCIISKKLIEG